MDTQNVPSLGNFFPPPALSNPTPVGDAQSIEHAEWWLFNDCPDAGSDRLASAVEAAAALRDLYRLSSSLAEAQLNDVWNRVACEPPLTPSQIAEAVRQAYCFRPAVIGAQAAPTPLQPGTPTAVAPPQHGAQTTPAPSERAAQPLPVDSVDLSAVEMAEQPEPLADPSPTPDEPQAEPGDDAHEVLIIEADPSRGARETLQKLLAQGKDCPIIETTVARRGNVRRFVHSLPPDTRVKKRTIGPGITVMGCSENAAFEGCEIVKDLPRVPPAKSVSARFTRRVPSKAPRDESASVNTKNTKKSAGRPPGRTKDRPFQMRVDDAFITKIDDWRRQQPDFPNRTESVRRLVEQALGGRQLG
jgi:hypothetical protein